MRSRRPSRTQPIRAARTLKGPEGTRTQDETDAAIAKLPRVERGREVGELYFWDGDKLARIEPGADGQHLRSKGPGNHPVWETPASGGGPGSVSAIDIATLSGVQAAWNLEGDLVDRSGNSLNLSVAAGDVHYAWIHGKQCAYVDPACRLERATNDTALTITGDLTVHVLMCSSGYQAGSTHHMFAFHNSGGRPANNYLYSLYSAATQNGIRYYDENGGGGSSDVLLGPYVPGQWALFSLTRSGNNLTLYMNGKSVGTGTNTTPTGGTTSKFGLGCNPGSGSSAWPGFYGDCVIQNVAMSAADVLTVAQQVGVAA